MSMIAYLDTTESPAGPVVFAANEAGSLIRLRFREGNYTRSIEDLLEDEGYEIADDVERTEPIREQIDAYTRGELINFDLDVELHGTEWQKRVWRELVNIPFGETRSYGDVARVV
jgi:methylated-DNA-[protein]-cysteine S-methyltransferase